MASSKITEVLENDMLLELICQQLDSSGPNQSKYLTTCRLVSHKWKRIATRCLQKNNWENRKFLHLPSGIKLEKYMRMCSSPTSCLFSCYDLESEYQFASPVQPELIVKFGNTLGSRVKTLSFSATISPDITIHINNHLQKFPSLNELRIFIPREEPWAGPSIFDADKEKEVHSSPSEENMQVCPLNSKDQVDIYNSMRLLCLTLELRWRFGVPKIPSHHDKILENILSKIPIGNPFKICLVQWECPESAKLVSVLQKYNQVKNLKVLLCSKTHQDVLRSLRLAGAQLQFFGIKSNRNSNNGKVSPMDVFRFLNSQVKNLEMLDWESVGGYFKFPQQGMTALKKLRMTWINKRRDSEEEMEIVRTIPPILYEHLFPNLEELQLVSNYDFSTPDVVDFLSLFLGPQLTCISLRKLGVRYPKMSAQLMRSISSTFPLITSLEIRHDKDFMLGYETEREFFSVLWCDSNFAANLKELFIEMEFEKEYHSRHGEFELDSLFSGVDDEQIEELSQSLNVEEFKKLQIVPAHPSILNIRNLRKLTICATHEFASDCGAFFSNFSGICTFGRITNLEFLHLELGIRRFSKPVMAHLRGTLRKNSPVGSSCSRLSPEERVEEVFRNGFTYSAVGFPKRVSLPDDEGQDLNYKPSTDQSWILVPAPTTAIYYRRSTR